MRRLFALILIFNAITFVTASGSKIGNRYTFCYNTNDDSIRTIKKNGRIEEITYYPDNKIKSKKFIYKNKVGSKGYSFIKYKYVEWDEYGNKKEKYRKKQENHDAYYKYKIWFFREDGKICFKREKEKVTY